MTVTYDSKFINYKYTYRIYKYPIILGLICFKLVIPFCVIVWIIIYCTDIYKFDFKYK